MPYGDENTGLMALLAASQSGLDPSIAYGEMQRLQAEQQAQVAQRQERNTGLLGMLQEMAMGGMPYAGAEAMLDAAPGPMGPALQSGLQALYPTGGEDQMLASNIEGMVRDPQTGGLVQSEPGQQGIRGPQAAQFGMGAEAMSPAFVPPQPDPSEQMAAMEFEQQQAIQSDLVNFSADAAQARADEWTPDQFIAEAQKNNPELFALAPEEVQAILEQTFGPLALETRGVAG